MFKKLAVLFALITIVLPLSVSAQDGPTAVPVTTEPVQYTRVNHENIQFTFDAQLADAVAVANYPATTGDVQIPSPAFTEFTFEGYAGGGEFLNHALMPRIDIYAIEDFGPYPEFIKRLDDLSRLLAERPDLNQYTMPDTGTPDALTLPFLPILPAAQVFRAQPEYINVANVRGIRYLVYYSQALNPIVEGEVFYTFQGITDDGQHYVSLLMPLNTGVLPTELPIIDDPDAYAAAYQQYLLETVGSLTQADPQTFTPALSVLDSLAQSVVVGR